MKWLDQPITWRSVSVDQISNRLLTGAEELFERVDEEIIYVLLRKAKPSGRGYVKWGRLEELEGVEALDLAVAVQSAAAFAQSAEGTNSNFEAQFHWGSGSRSITFALFDPPRETSAVEPGSLAALTTSLLSELDRPTSMMFLFMLRNSELAESRAQRNEKRVDDLMRMVLMQASSHQAVGELYEPVLKMATEQTKGALEMIAEVLKVERERAKQDAEEEFKLTRMNKRFDFMDGVFTDVKETAGKIFDLEGVVGDVLGGSSSKASSSKASSDKEGSGGVASSGDDDDDLDVRTAPVDVLVAELLVRVDAATLERLRSVDPGLAESLEAMDPAKPTTESAQAFIDELCKATGDPAARLRFMGLARHLSADVQALIQALINRGGSS